MRLKTFTSKTLPETMALVRERLGEDAVILSTQELDGAVKVTAALDDDLAPELEENGRLAAAEWLSGLSELLEAHRTPNGLVDRLLNAAVQSAAQDPEEMLVDALSSVFDFAPLRFRRAGQAKPAPLLIMGQPGAGKTATAAKLCAKARLAGQQAHLVSMDTVSAGAREQVTAFAEALSVPLSFADSAAELSKVVAKIPSDRLIVIDTMGANPFVAEELAALAGALHAGDALGLLVQPAGGDALEAAESALAFAEIGARLFIPSRLDAARRFGGLLAAAQAAELSIMAGGVSPSLGSGLSPLTPRGLAKLLAPHWSRQSAVEDDDLPATGTFQ